MASIPSKLFDVRTGKDAVDKDGTVYPQATLVVFRNQAAQDAIIESFASQYGYQVNIPDPNNPANTIPNPKTKVAFYREKVTDFIKDIHRAAAVKATDAAVTAARQAADSDLP